MTGGLDSPDIRAAAARAWRRHLGPAWAGAEELQKTLVEGSLPEAFHQTAVRVPDRLALELDGVGVTHGQVDALTGRCAGWLRAQGVAPGAAVVLSGGTSLSFVVAYLGALRAGAMVVLANPTLTRPELEHLVADSGAVLAIAEPEGRERLEGLPGRDGELRVVALEALVGSEPGIGEISGAPYLEPAPLDGGQPALLAYTSGTTGKPKGVPLTHANLLSSIRGVMLAWRWTEDDVLVHSLPLFHQHGLGGVHATLLAGSRATIMSKFDPEALIAAIGKSGGTVLFGVPAIYERLASWLEEKGADLRSLRLAVSGSAPLSPALAGRLEELLGQVPLERYGTTESGLNISNPYDGPRKPGLVGIPLPGVELAIVRDGELQPDGESGEIVLRGPQVFPGYWGNPEADAGAFHPGGWFRTGDAGRVDPEDGYLEITGRLKELIITGGMNVYPREVVLALEESPAVAEAAVVGVPSERWGEEVVAAVVPASGELDEEALIAFARSRLAPYKCPKRVVAVDSLPTNHMGKVVAAEVRKLVAQ